MNKAMSKSHLLIVMLFAFIGVSQSNAQSLTEKLGGTRTDFIITSDTAVFEVFDQILIKRGKSKVGTVYDGGYGYGYQTYHLEFISRDKIKKIRKRGEKNDFHVMELIDQNGGVIAKIYPRLEDVIMVSNREKPFLYTYMINLEEVPLILLEKTKRINIVYIEQRWRYE
jgi:hypothetical protein